MSRHTPGPWALRPRSDWSAPIVQRGREGGFVVQGLSPEAEDADARLIAAAPELLSVVLAVDDLAERIDHEPDSALGELVARARAAIAKATGAEA